MFKPCVCIRYPNISFHNNTALFDSYRIVGLTAMGVRFNAEKTKVGSYYSTPIFRFKMRCHWCEKFFEMETDPANRDYKIISGLRRQERKWDPSANGQFAPEGTSAASAF